MKSDYLDTSTEFSVLISFSTLFSRCASLSEWALHAFSFNCVYCYCMANFFSLLTSILQSTMQVHVMKSGGPFCVACNWACVYRTHNAITSWSLHVHPTTPTDGDISEARLFTCCWNMHFGRSRCCCNAFESVIYVRICENTVCRRLQMHWGCWMWECLLHATVHTCTQSPYMLIGRLHFTSCSST